MTSDELPPQAVSIKCALSKGTCTAATVEALEQIHHNNQDRRPALATRLAGTRRPRTQTANVGASKAGGRKPRKQALIAVLEDHEDVSPVLSLWEKFKLATFVVNHSLRVLTSLAQSSSRSPTSPTKPQKPLSKHAAVQTYTGDPGADSQTPLRSLPINQVMNFAEERRSEARSWPATPEGTASGLLATARCGSIAFAILRSIDAQKTSEIQVANLQIEQGMSVFIGKLITFGLYEMAVEELQILKGRLETPEAPSTLGNTSTRFAGKTSTKLQIGSTKDSLPDLLIFNHTNAKGHLLDLMITFQFQVLKVISARRNASALEAAIKHLDLDLPSSPTSLIERQIDQNYPQKSVKAVQQFDSLSRLLFQLCNGPRLREQHLSSNKSTCPSIEFQYCVLATKIRLKWWKIAKHQGDALKEIVRPFETCLASFRQRSSLTAKEKYSLSREYGERLLTYLHNLIDQPVRNVAQALSEVQLMLANGAQESSQFKDADRWLNESHRTLLSVSPTSQVCTLMCRQASLYVRLWARSGSKQKTLGEMTDLCTLLEHDMGPSPKETSEIMTELNAFRKTLLAMVRTHYQMPISAEDKSLDFLVWCSRILSSALKFISDVVAKIQKQKDGETQAPPQLTLWDLIWQITDPFIESLAILAKLSMACSSNYWDSIDAGLQCSIALIRGSDSAVNHKKYIPNIRSSTNSCIVSISNAYWCRFLNRKTSMANLSELQGLLAASIEAVSDQPTSVQDAALLPVKLEKQAFLHESSEEYFEAARAHANIMKILIANGSVSSAADAAATDSVNVVFKKTAVFGVISRSLRGYVTAMTSEAATALSPQLILDFKELPIVERGLILEHQLAAHSSIISSRGYSTKGLQAVNQLASTLLSIYTAEEYPVRRLRVSLKLVQMNSGHSLGFSQGIQEQLLWNPTSNEQGSSSGQDVGLQQYYNHLCTRRNLYTEPSSNVLNPKCLDYLLDAWYYLLQESHDWSALELCVDDVADWMLQLRALVQVLDLEGLEFQRVSALQLLVKLYEMADPIQLANLISTLIVLGVQIASLGYSGSAGLIFQQAQRYMSKTTLSTPDTIGWHLAYAEYLVSIGNHDKSESHLSIARDLFHDYDRKRLHGNQAIELFSTAASVHAQLSAARGDSSKALFFCRLRVKLLHRLWAGPEDRISRSTNNEVNLSIEIGSIAESMTSLSICNRSRPLASTKGDTELNEFDKHLLIPQLFSALTNLAEIYAHEGLLPESQYYMEQSAKISSNTSSTALQARYHTQLGHYLIRGENYGRGVIHLNKAEATLTSKEPNRHLVILQLARAEKYAKSGELSLAMSSLEFADSTLEKIMQVKSMDRLRSKQSNVAILEASPPTKNGIRSKSKALAIKGAACTPVASETAAARPRANEVSALQYTRARLLRRQASIALKDGDVDRADSLLRRAAQHILTSFDHITQTSLTAKIALGRALANMASDLVFCVIPESSTCYPSTRLISGHQDTIRDELEEKPANQSASAKNSKSCKVNTKAVKPPGAAVLPDFMELLSRSQKDLNKARSLAISAGSTMNLHSIVDGLMRVMMMLSAFPNSKTLCMQTPLFAMYGMEIGRTVAMARQHLALGIERQISQTKAAAAWPANDHYNLALSDDSTLSDLTCFQSQYLDIIPKSWTVLSLTLSESRDEIRITKFRSCHGPFILNLPLDRHSQDRGEETFGFEQGKAELRDIVALANYSTHDAPDPSRKGAKTAWWEARAALDARLKDLLVNIESIWFGGFRGIFDNNVGSPDLLSRFQQSLNNITDKYLPSRAKQTKVKKYDRVILDPHVLELFVALGSPNEREIDEDLLDLLYFVVDILQFHGEHNAYDEIDFDGMTIELVDALRQYHEAASKQDHQASPQHTILILDKAMHCFPWESLPCLMGQAVSRLPSLGCLRDRILQYTKQQHQENISPLDPMLTVNRSNGAYVINPSGDLTATQSRFEAPLEKLPDWKGIKNREPSEGEMKEALESKELFLYFGHGSGSQYIRSRTVQKLDKCAVALLMGCSSGALTEAGEFESYGTPINYMHAGCPAVLATLWDVTDKDIDRFSQAVLEKWGLFEEEEPLIAADVCASPVKKGPKSRGKSKVRKADKSVKKKDECRSLDQAVAESRDSCIMRYLNGAAPVIYGVPVMLS